MRLGAIRGTARQPTTAAGISYAQSQRQTPCRRCRIQSDQYSRERRQSDVVVMASGARFKLLGSSTSGTPSLPRNRTTVSWFQVRCSRQRPRPRTKPTRKGGRRAAVAPAARTNGALPVAPALRARRARAADALGNARLLQRARQRRRMHTAADRLQSVLRTEVPGDRIPARQSDLAVVG